MKPRRLLLSMLVILAASLGPVQSRAADCPETEVVIDRTNSVHGLKEGKLFAYVDLAAMATDLNCHNDEAIQKMVMDAVVKSVNEWWQEERLAKATIGEVHVISILDKDEYAKADFNSALTHGKIDFTRDGDKIEAAPVTLDFSNMKEKLKD